LQNKKDYLRANSHRKNRYKKKYDSSQTKNSVDSSADFLYALTLHKHFSLVKKKNKIFFPYYTCPWNNFATSLIKPINKKILRYGKI
jgi:hypothetical protein